uniref:Uncharacterized protein n=1 Tax=Borely moumouvirus TaxID=2712067 RepID=A0A6G6ACQ3_9VIRU
MSLATAAYRTAVKSTGSQEIAQLVSKTHGLNIDFSETEQEFVYRERHAMAHEIFTQMKIFNDAFQNAMDHEFFRVDLDSTLAEKMQPHLRSIISQLPCPGVYCQGGYYRDFFAGIKNFNDIDLKFPSIEFAELFQEHCITLPYKIKVSSTGYSSGCISLELTHKEFSHIKLPVDLGYQINNVPQYFDMDVNMLVSTVDIDDPGFMTTLQVANPDCDLQSVIEHCVARTFVVFSKSGKSVLSHQNLSMIAEYDEEGLMTGTKTNWNTFHYDCICSDSRAKKLRMRIKKMQERGWIRLNSDCKNPFCVLASDKLVSELADYFKRQEQARKQAKLRCLNNKQQRLQESIMMSMSRIPGYIPRKTGNRLSHETRVKGHQKDLLRKERVKAKKQSLERFNRRKSQKHSKCEW